MESLNNLVKSPKKKKLCDVSEIYHDSEEKDK